MPGGNCGRVPNRWAMPDWLRLLDGAAAHPTVVVVAHTFIRAWPSASRPVLLACDDGSQYVVKAAQAGRMVANDQMVGHLGEMAGCPTGRPMIVDVPAELIAIEPQMQHMIAGPAHGSSWVADCSEREGVAHIDVAENRPRFAALAGLFGWVGGSDHQFIYRNEPPRLVYSVDHGHIFPNGPDWTEASLAGTAAPGYLPDLVASCRLTQQELEAASPPFAGLSDEDIANAVAAPPDVWGLAREERIAVLRYLVERRDAMFKT